MGVDLGNKTSVSPCCSVNEGSHKFGSFDGSGNHLFNVCRAGDLNNTLNFTMVVVSWNRTDFNASMASLVCANVDGIFNLLLTR